MNMLNADALHNDPRVAEARRLLHEALSDHQEHITGVKGPTAELVDSYQKTMDQFSEMRGGKLWYPYLGSGIGNGCLVELADGSVKYDFICGIGVHYWGHSSHDLLDSSIDAALGDTIMQGHLQQNCEQAELSKLLLQGAGNMDHVFLTTSGAMANENALKICFQNKHPASRVLAFEHCFMGRTCAISQITDKPQYRSGLPSNVDVDYLPFFDEKDPEGSTEKAVATLKSHIARYPDQHAVFVFEPVQGEGGFYPGSREFFVSLMEVCREHGILVFADEVQTFGRLPSLFAYQHFALDDYIDIVTIGKLTQVCATLYKAPLKPRPGLLSQTYTGSTSAVKAAQVIIRSLMEDGYLGPDGKINKIHERMVGHLKGIADRNPGLVSGPFGIGCMIAFTPLDGSAGAVSKVSRALFDAGVIAFGCGGQPSRIRFLIPAGAVTEADIDAVAGILEKTLVEQQQLCPS